MLVRIAQVMLVCIVAQLIATPLLAVSTQNPSVVTRVTDQSAPLVAGHTGWRRVRRYGVPRYGYYPYYFRPYYSRYGHAYYYHPYYGPFYRRYYPDYWPEY
jgi:hypothetical protein